MDRLFEIKTAAIIFLGSLATLLGWRLLLVGFLVLMMCLDYWSGTIAARRNGEWKSQMARDGLAHKAGMILVVAVCAIADLILLLASQNLTGEILGFEWPMAIFPIMTLWYILTEAGSIIENAVKMGANIPPWLPKILDTTLGAVNAVGDGAITDNTEK